jgi:hypothetical protein
MLHLDPGIVFPSEGPIWSERPNKQLNLNDLITQ